MDDLSKARKLLEEGGYTCVLCKGETVHTSRHRGVKPLLELIDSSTNARGFSAADKVVGKATALLYCLLGVREVYAQVISTAAAQVLHAHGVAASWGKQVDFIRNREETGRCPMELATEHISDPQGALTAIRTRLKELQG